MKYQIATDLHQNKLSVKLLMFRYQITFYCNSSPINKAAEAGNLDEFIRLYQFDNSRLSVKDGKGRTVAHQAAAKNKKNILEFIFQNNGGKKKFYLHIKFLEKG